MGAAPHGRKEPRTPGTRPSARPGGVPTCIVLHLHQSKHNEGELTVDLIASSENSLEGTATGTSENRGLPMFFFFAVPL